MSIFMELEGGRNIERENASVFILFEERRGVIKVGSRPEK